MKILTISIAAYNVENYIRQALDSLIDESIIDDIEVFVVDDGGRDNTLTIAKEYEEKYPNSIHAIHKENGGYGSTVNYSIAHATGKYFKILDGDDYFIKENFIRLINELKNETSDVVVTNFMHVTNDGELIKKREFKGNGVAFLKDYTGNPFPMHAMCILTDIIKKSGLVLPEHSLYTDNYVITIPLLYTKTISFKDYDVYQYRIGRVGQSVEVSTMMKHFDEAITILLDISSIVLQNKNNDNYRYIKKRIASSYVCLMRPLFVQKTNNANKKKFIQCEKQLKKANIDVYKQVKKTYKLGKLIWIFRKTGYTAYFMLRFLKKHIEI